MEIRKTETPSRELLLLADEVEASVADYIGRVWISMYCPTIRPPSQAA